MEEPAVKKSDLLDLIWESREEGFTALEHEVIYRELCSGCGLCVAVCPEDVIGFTEYPKLVGKCTNCGYCLIACPRSFLPKKDVEERIFGQAGEDIGNIVGVYSVKSKEKGQDGGFVTALLKYMLKKRIVDGALVSKIDKAKVWKPRPAVVTTAKEVEEASGSRYSTSPNLSALKEAEKKGLKKLAVVGTPCHIDGIAKLRLYPVENVSVGGNVAYSISIFCKSNYLYSMLSEVVEKKHGVKLEEVKKFDIKGKNLLVHDGREEKAIPLTEIHEHVRLGCKVCDDFTGVFSDFAVGSVDTAQGYSTVITRTKKADSIIKDMKKEGLIEVEQLSGEDLTITKKLSENKKKGAKKAASKMVREELPMPLKFLWE